MMTEFLQRAARAGATLGGLWNGVIQIAHAGLMDHHECSLHPDNHAFVQEHFALIKLSEHAIAIDRNRLSAAGPNSSLDLMLTLIQRQFGLDTVEGIRRILRADNAEDNPVEGALARNHERQLPASLQNALQLMRHNLDEPLNRTELARYLGVSTRGLERLFRQHLQTSPARHYMELRLVRARQLLAHSDDSIADIAVACGFVSAPHFSRSFFKRFGMAPREVRR